MFDACITIVITVVAAIVTIMTTRIIIEIITIPAHDEPSINTYFAEAMIDKRVQNQLSHPLATLPHLFAHFRLAPFLDSTA